MKMKQNYIQPTAFDLAVNRIVPIPKQVEQGHPGRGKAEEQGHPGHRSEKIRSIQGTAARRAGTSRGNRNSGKRKTRNNQSKFRI